MLWKTVTVDTREQTRHRHGTLQETATHAGWNSATAPNDATVITRLWSNPAIVDGVRTTKPSGPRTSNHQTPVALLWQWGRSGGLCYPRRLPVPGRRDLSAAQSRAVVR